MRKCGTETILIDAVQRGIGHLGWGSAGNSGAVSGVLGCNLADDARRADAISGYASPGVLRNV